MNMNSYFTEEELVELGFKKVGKNVKISRKSSIYSPETISIGDNVRIDDFCCIAGGEKGISIGSYVHIAIFSAIFGGGGVTLGDYTGISSRTVLYSSSDDYSGSFLTNPTIPSEYLNVDKGEIFLNKHVIIGTNSTILPNVIIGEGSAVGAYSLVTKNLESWGIYTGVPVKRIKSRKKDLLELEKKLVESLKK